MGYAAQWQPGTGNQIGNHFIRLAKQHAEKQGITLPAKDLAYFNEDGETAGLFELYMRAVKWCQDYAAENRVRMLDLTLDALRETLPPFYVSDHAINCHHNYVATEIYDDTKLYVTRKGQFVRVLVRWVLSLARWVQSRSLSEGRVINKAGTLVLTAPAAACHGLKRRNSLPKPTWKHRRKASSAVRTRVLLTKSPARIRTSTK